MLKNKTEKFIILFLSAFNITSPAFTSTLVNSKIIYDNLDHFNLIDKVNLTYSFENFQIFSKSLTSNEFANKLNNENHSNIVYRENLENLKYINNELEIESNIQSEKDNILNAEGNVVVRYKGHVFIANSLTYDKNTKIGYAVGDIKARINNQLFFAEKISYDFHENKGILFKVKGFINTNNLLSDLDFTLSTTNPETKSIIKDLKKKRVLHTPGELTNWIFTAEELTIQDDMWVTDKAFFTNDLLDSSQIKLEFNKLEVYSNQKNIKLKSKINYLVLENKLRLPFWLGERTILKEKEEVEVRNSWNIGYDSVDKDGFYLGRQFIPIELSKNTFWNLQPQFLLERSIKGYTKSFVKQDSRITSDRVKRDISLSDYFALNSEIKGTLDKWDFKIEKEINSFDMQKFHNAFRMKTEIIKKIKFLNSIFDNKFYGVYRERVWNGSIGESEIYGGYGWKLEKQKTSETDGIEKKETIGFGLGNFKAEELNTKDINKSIKGGIYYEVKQKFPILINKLSDNSIDKSFVYIPEPIKKGLFLKTKVSGLYNFYKYGKHQEYIGLGAGPELKLGNFKKNYFDYSRISLLPFYKFKSGQSVFKFDEINEKFTLNIAYDQHLLGPILIKTQGKLNLDSDSDDYGEFIESKISINWKKRSFELGFFYQPHNESGGLNFALFGFK